VQRALNLSYPPGPLVNHWFDCDQDRLQPKLNYKVTGDLLAIKIVPGQNAL